MWKRCSGVDKAHRADEVHKVEELHRVAKEHKGGRRCMESKQWRGGIAEEVYHS